MSIFAIIAAVIPSLATAYTVNANVGKEGWLEDQNYYRCMHNAEPLYWDDNLAAKAQNWANHLGSIKSMTHSKSYATFPYSGENLAMGYKDLHISMKSWYSEYDMWKCNGDWRNVSGKFGHFTAMVWKGINRIGCGISNGYYVCEYGSSNCMENTGSKASSKCSMGEPSSLPNFNSSSKCGSDGKKCVDCYNSSKANECAAKTTPVYFGGSSPSVTTISPVPTGNPITSTRVVTAPNGQVLTDEAVKRLMACSPERVQAANQKCKNMFGTQSYCQILAAYPACVGYPGVECFC